MKTYALLYLAVLSLSSTFLPHATRAQPGPGSERESRMLMHLLRMDNSELAKLRETVERIEAMSPEERSKLRQQLGKLQKMDPAKREALRQRFEAIPEDKREAMRQRWFEMSPEERREWRQKLRNMSPEERADMLQNSDFRPKDLAGETNKPQGPDSDRKGPPPPLE